MRRKFSFCETAYLLQIPKKKKLYWWKDVRYIVSWLICEKIILHKNIQFLLTTTVIGLSSTISSVCVAIAAVYRSLRTFSPRQPTCMLLAKLTLKDAIDSQTRNNRYFCLNGTNCESNLYTDHSPVEYMITSRNNFSKYRSHKKSNTHPSVALSNRQT